MQQSPVLYAMDSTWETLTPWLDQYVPDLDLVAWPHFTHLVAGIVEQQSLLVRAIAAASPFLATPESNFTQVQRIIRDTRLTLETVYYPFLMQILAHMPGDHRYLTLDETNHGQDFNLVLVGLATDAVSLPLGFIIYPVDGCWADDARQLLVRLETVLPAERTITLLADRVHAGEPFLTCLDALGWGSVIRLAESTCIMERPDTWTEVRHLRQRHGRMRVFTDVRIGKGSTRCATVCLTRQRLPTGGHTTWYLVTNLTGGLTRFVEYACRWWQECTHKLLKSGGFGWEQRRVVDPARVTVLLMACGCAIWALWLLGRQHERLAQRKPTTTRSQPRRQNLVKRGWDVLQTARKQHRMPILPAPPPPRVLDYVRRLPGFRLPCDLLVELW